MLNRRNLLLGAALIIPAPALVHAVMPISSRIVKQSQLIATVMNDDGIKVLEEGVDYSVNDGSRHIYDYTKRSLWDTPDYKVEPAYWCLVKQTSLLPAWYNLQVVSRFDDKPVILQIASPMYAMKADEVFEVFASPLTVDQRRAG